MDEPERRIRDLEWRLQRYHEDLEAALEHNAQFQLNATWGIIRGTGFMVLLGVNWAFNKLWREWTGEDAGWIIGIGLFIAAGAVWYSYTGYVERGAEDDKKKLLRWPEWERRD